MCGIIITDVAISQLVTELITFVNEGNYLSNYKKNNLFGIKDNFNNIIVYYKDLPTEIKTNIDDRLYNQDYHFYNTNLYNEYFINFLNT